MDQEQTRSLKHYCRVCKRGFGCGRALGGHMRAHGISEDPSAPDFDEDPPNHPSEWDDKPLENTAGGKTLYALRPNASRVRGHRVCENCGKEFQSWKSFLDHGRCNSDDELSPPSSPHSYEKEGSHTAVWNKGKRSQRPKPSPPANWLSTEEEDLANSLIMLSSAEVDPVVLFAEPEESSASTSKEEEDPAFLMRCAAEMSTTPTRPKPPIAPITPPVPRGMFECKACKKVFTSHQALGGHRASHKKVKGCFAAKLDLDPDPKEDIDQIGTSSATALEIAQLVDNPHPPVPEAQPVKKKPRIHECSICHRQFSSGQALGGHKRCHWITSSSVSTDIIPTTTTVNNLQQQMPKLGSTTGANLQDFTLRSMLDNSDTLDLNLPAPIDDLAGIPLRLDAPAAVYIKPPWDIDSKSKLGVYTSSNDVNNDDRKNLRASNPANLEDEADSKVDVAKLSDLKGMKVEEESSPWLQVGIGGSSASRNGRA